MKEPLNQFADRIIHYGEVREFIKGLILKGVNPSEIKEAAEQTEQHSKSLIDAHCV